jgi:hypothetical protein
MRTRAPLLLIIVCLGPMFIYIPTALLMVPHQARIALGGYGNALWTIAWYVGTAALAVGVRAMYVFIRDDGRRILHAGVVRASLLCGLAAIAMGPFGMFVVGGDASALIWVVYVILPILCVVRLGAQSRRYVLWARAPHA